MGYAFADMDEAFDGRFIVVRRDHRKDYGEARINGLVDYRGRIIDVTFTPRGGKVQLISVRPASREERGVYNDKRLKR